MNEKPLRELLELSDSGTWGEEKIGINSFPILRSSNIKSNKLIFNNLPIIEIPEKDISKKILKDGDIIVTKSSGSPDLVAKCALFIAPDKSSRFYFSNFMLRLRPNPRFLDSKWLYFFLVSPIGKSIIDRMNNTTSGLRNLNLTSYLSQLIPVPLLSDQKRIVEILDKADLIRQKRKESIALLDEFLRSVFLDMFGDPVMNEKRWEKKSFESIIEVERNQIYPDDIESETIYIDLESIQKQTGKIINCRKVQSGFIQSSKFKFTADHILYGKLRPYLNKVALPDFNGVCSTDILPIIPKENRSNKYFLSQLMRHSYFVNYMNEKSSGANLPRVNVQTIYGFESIIPPFKLQAQFAKIVEQVETTKAKMEESLKEMDNQFNGLLQRAFIS